MGISEVRRHFAAYGSGELPEGQLRNLIRNSLAHEPQLGEQYVALADACLRANLIGPRLQSNIKADIREITSPSFDLTLVQPFPARAEPGWVDERAANSTDVHLAAGPRSAGPGRSAVEAPREAVEQARPARTGTDSSGSWDLESAATETGAALYPGSVLRDRFVLVEELGHGGMGVVFKAYDRSRGDVQDRYVAIKVLSEEFKRHPLAVKALQREARKAQRLAHPNIVAVHDFDRDGGNVFMVMELLSGRPLDQVLREDGQGGVPMSHASGIIRSLASALSYAHEHGIVHCDFKPSNAFLGRDGRVKVLDFGIARAAPSPTGAADATLFDAGQLGAVSPSYASLERLQGAAPDIRDDLYSFACVVYELLTGLHPYQRIDAVKASQAKLEPRPIRKLSRQQWRALRQGLAFRRVERCATIDSLAYPLLAPKSNRPMWIGLSAAAIVAAAVAGALIWKGPEVTQTASDWISTVRHQYFDTLPAARDPAPESVPEVAATDAAVAPDATPVEEPQVTSVTAPQEPDAAAIVAPTPTQTVTPAAAVDSVAASAPPALDDVGSAKRRVEIDMLKEQFESQAIDGDVPAATKSAAALNRESPGSAYVTTDVPRILALTYVRHAKTQFEAGQVNDALQTLAEGRRKFGRSTELREQEVKYVAAADLYDRLSSAVVLQVKPTQASLQELKSAQGDDFAATAQMLAQTLADRIADHRAAGRAPVADKLEEAGRQLFPESAALLDSGHPGRLAATPIEVTNE